MLGSKLRVALGAVSALVLLGAVSGCANPIESAVQEAAEGVLEESMSGGNGDSEVDLGISGSASLPEGWPSEIPVPNGDPVSAIKTDKGFSVNFRVDLAESERIVSQFPGSGFTEETVTDMGEMKAYSFAGSAWRVQLGVILDEDDESNTILGYVVVPAS